MKIVPLHDWVVIQSGGPEERTAGGIIIPEIAKEKPQWGIVESAGPGRFESDAKDPKAEKKFVPTEVRAGDKVLYEKYMAKEFKVNGHEVTMVRERSILGVVEGKDAGALEKRGPSALQKKEHGAVAEVKKPEAKKKTAKK